MRMKQPEGKNCKENGEGAKPALAKAFWEPTPERKMEYLKDLAKNECWMDIVFYCSWNEDVAQFGIGLLARNAERLFWLESRDGVELGQMTRRICHEDADRVFEFIATESTDVDMGKRAVAELVLGGWHAKVAEAAARGMSPGVSMYALEQLYATGNRELIKQVVEHPETAVMVRDRAGRMLEKMEANDLEAGGNGC